MARGRFGGDHHLSVLTLAWLSGDRQQPGDKEQGADRTVVR
ncbi:MAG TPA: hypothetical protein VN047_00310 [Sphingopyxis sp.]|nr:hypothetical protein [Sphingopyxis sp.]HWW55311.1 hypothetical protein [Sphingopyxis sp.]